MLRRLFPHYCLFFLQLLTYWFDFFSPSENLYLMLFQKRKKFIKILGLGEAICSAGSSADALMRPMTC